MLSAYFKSSQSVKFLNQPCEMNFQLMYLYIAVIFCGSRWCREHLNTCTVHCTSFLETPFHSLSHRDSMPSDFSTFRAALASFEHADICYISMLWVFLKLSLSLSDHIPRFFSRAFWSWTARSFRTEAATAFHSTSADSKHV